jgi:hypothetical protein
MSLPTADIAMYSGDGCTTGASDRPAFTTVVRPNTCFVRKNPENNYAEIYFSSAFADVTVPKGVNCSVSLCFPSDVYAPKDRAYTGPPNTCAPSVGKQLSSGSFNCNEIPLPSEWPQADVTIYTSNICGQGLGLSQHKYPNIEANICTKADVSYLVLGDLRIQSGKAELMADTQIPIPPGTECKLVLFQKADYRPTSVPSNVRGGSGVGVKPLATLYYPIEAFIWQRGYA